MIPDVRAFARFGTGIQLHDPCLVLKPEMVILGDGVRIDSFTKLEGGQGVIIGNYVHIASFAHVNIGGGSIEIGEGVGIASGAKILGGSNQEDGHYMSCAVPQHLQRIVRDVTTIERGAFIGTNATVLPGVTIGEFAIIAAGAVVTHDVPAHEVWAGVPAQKLRDRRP